WALALDEAPAELTEADVGVERALRRATHQTIRKVTDDVSRFRFNTMVAALMELSNHLGRVQRTTLRTSPAWAEAIDALLRPLAPSAPHLTEEIWARLGRRYRIHDQPWPTWDEAPPAEAELELPVQVN